MNVIAMAVLYAGVAWRSRAKRKWVGNAAMVLATSLILLVSQFEPAAAQNLDALQNAADRLVQFFTGPFGRSVGAIAFIGMFLAAAFGYWSWGALLRVGGSLAGMFAAAELVDFLAGSGS
ncbi:MULTISPECIES: TrbC/VirB2 family protein [Rhizobium]|uniref:Conjugal transfer protein TrbC n=1 Tax=Rhizobium sullae TaxID=50338 RepID=A0A2N0CYI6_RHISU|nr:MULTISPECIES: TrbC/VirB2 family protein [Rhizobium]KAF5881648.1 TrbC/VirB2 family protein [Rhizobium sp. PEPV16]MBX5174095.1 conjugal transfer protein TrbC [Rhizobium sp. NZLR1b]MBX5187030.1 conjugal transfer protein TrbC [Rhizobium sp. NZLR5]MBY3026087.1 conjugal transfer protein TrbC [Rhizobium leguminosarum]MBY3036997.1 conjugal transfer protein TrbC [Rhizobium laguerreae]